MKYFYEFSVNKESEVEESVVETSPDGTEITTKKKVKKSIPVKFLLRKPNRALRDAADLIYNKRIAEASRLGLFTSAGLSKIIENENGILSDKDKELKKETYNKLLNSQGEYQRLASKPEKTEEEAAQILISEKDISDSLAILKEIERKESQLYNNTAEMYAQNKVLFWWTLVLAHVEEGANIVPFFGEVDPALDIEKALAKRLVNYDEKEEKEDPFLIEAINQLAHYTAVAFITSSFDQEKMEVALKKIRDIEVA